MNRRNISANIHRFLRLQGLCGAIILSVWLIYWAVDNPIRNVRDLCIYVLIQANPTVFLLHPLKVFYEERRVHYHWPLHVIAILAVNCVVVVISAAVMYRVDAQRVPFIDFLHQSWKFPFVANLVFAFAYEGYKVTTRRLRRHNKQLQRAIEVETAEREIEAEELERARDIQRGLLPKDIPQLSDFAIAGAWEPARAVGGDYYDVIPLTNDKLGLCIADVAGKGISAALLMANVQAAVRAFATEDLSPSRMCSQINSVLCANTASDKFVTLFYGVLDGSELTLTYTNAGHPPPMLVAGDGSVRHLDSNAAVLGVIPDWPYVESKVKLNRGDLLLLYTDGIVEAMSSDGQEFGEDRLIESVHNSVALKPDDIQREILTEVKQFCHDHLSDDATLVVVALRLTAAEQDRELRRIKEQPIHLAGVSS